MYFNIYLVIVIYFMNFMNFDFIFKFFILHCKKIYTLKLIISWTWSLNFSLLVMIFALKVFFLPFNECECWHNLLANGFFQSPFEVNKIFCLPNKFVLFTNHKQPLKCVWQKVISSCDQISYILFDKEFIF